VANTPLALFAGAEPAEGDGVMASLSKKEHKGYRIHWRFTVRAGPRVNAISS
jgi:hypothetical protein